MTYVMNQLTKMLSFETFVKTPHLHFLLLIKIVRTYPLNSNNYINSVFTIIFIFFHVINAVVDRSVSLTALIFWQSVSTTMTKPEVDFCESFSDKIYPYLVLKMVIIYVQIYANKIYLVNLSLCEYESEKEYLPRR